MPDDERQLRKISVMNSRSTDEQRPARIAERLLDAAPYREVIPRHPRQSFRAFSHDFPSAIARWQYHPEFEVHLIRKSTGSFIFGDHIGTFVPGQVTFLGAGLPHDWMSDLQPGDFFPDRDGVIQFDREWVVKCQKVMPELDELEGLLDESSRGLLYSGRTAELAAVEIEAVIHSSNTTQIAHMFRLLSLLVNAPVDEKQPLAGEWFSISRDRDAQAAVEAGISYIFEHLLGDIRMSEAAKLANMSEPTFSKYFKKASGLTFSDMVRKFRISQACRLLDSTSRSIASICTASGYANVANFNRQFLTETGMTPSEYRKSTKDRKPQAELIRMNPFT